MNSTKYQISNYRFQTKSEIEIAKEELIMIESLLKKYDFNTYEDVNELMKKMESGEIHFTSMPGRDFDDDLYELYERLRIENQSSVKRKPAGEEKSGKHRKRKDKIEFESLDEGLRAEIVKQLRKRERIRKCILTVMILLAVASFGYFGYDSYYSWKSGKESEILSGLIGKEATTTAKPLYTLTGDDGQTPEILDKYALLYQKNQRLVGWLKIEDTIIDYPVLQTVDNEYYLTHNFDQETDKNGSLFLDKDCQIINRNTNLIIYGHHMQSGKMFGTLNLYADIEYYKEHPYIEFDTIYEEGTYEIMYVFRSKIYNEEDIVFKYYQFLNAYTENEFQSYMKEMSNISLYDTGVEAEFGDQLLTLSTCDYQEDDGRFVVVAKRIN